jgi:serine-type D-Ala-D-Ala carboxypeptidase/endopeptidase
MTKSLILALILLSLMPQSQGQTRSEQLKVEIDKILRFDTDIDLKKTPGFIVGVIDGDSTYILPFGHKYHKSNLPLSSTDIFEIGSVTKIFTSTLIDILTRKGIIRYTDPVNQYLPIEYTNPLLSSLTIHDLVHHQSGMSKRPERFGKKEKNFQNPYEFYGNKDLLSYYRDYIPRKNLKFEYSHTNYALLELVITAATQLSYHDAIKRYILDEWGIDNAFVDFTEEKSNILTPGYDRSLSQVEPWTFASFKGSEGLHIDMDGLLGFTQAVMTYKYSDNVYKPSFNKSLSTYNGWNSIDMTGYKILSHTGKTSGHHAFIALVRERRAAVIILTNTSNGTEDLGFQILRMITSPPRNKPSQR